MGVAISKAPDYQPQSAVNTVSSELANGPFATPYTSFQRGFISGIVGASFLSLFSVLLLLVINVTRPPLRLGNYTHIPVIFGSLLVSNLLQSIGTILNARWVGLGRVESGTLCSLQGGIKQAGNVGTAVWSFALALHSFRLLFLRSRISMRGKWFTFGLGWTFIAFVTAIGPLAIEKKSLGPYFGPAGFWCWITDQYPAAQTFLEYMLEWTSAFFSFVLYVTVLLRVRGNLIQDTMGKWSLRWVPRCESWQLAFTRDYLDSCTVKMAAIIVWYPVTYTLLIVPISIARFASYAGAGVPHGFTFVADIVFALGGFANLLLFLGTRRFIPDVGTIPDFSTPRSRVDKHAPLAVGITPFVLTPRYDAEEKPPEMRMMASAAAAASDGGGVAFVSWSETSTEEGMLYRDRDRAQDPGASPRAPSSPLSIASHESVQPLNPRQ